MTDPMPGRFDRPCCKIAIMILFHLLCGQDHDFEGWFPSGAAYDEQAAAGGIACPVCSDRNVRKAPMAPGVLKGGSDAGNAVVALREVLADLHRRVEATCENVGERFPEEARRIHYGEAKERAIYGQASLEEARALSDEGVEFTLLPGRPRQES